MRSPLSHLRFRTRSLIILIVLLYAFICYVAYNSLPSSPSEKESDIRYSGTRDRHGSVDIDPHLADDRETIRRKVEVNKQLDDLRARLNISLQDIMSMRGQIQSEKDILAQERNSLFRPPGGAQGLLQEPLPSQQKIIGPVQHPLAPQIKPDNALVQAPSEQNPSALDLQLPRIPAVAEQSNYGADIEKRDFVKKMMKHAWDSYSRFAWGANEVRPLSRIGHNAAIFGQVPFGASIVDSLDTLFIMGLLDEYKAARAWVASELSFAKNAEVSVFEFNIRYVGGLLSAYALTGDTMYIQKATELVGRLLPAFNTASGIPYSLINLETRAVKNYMWASGGSSILSEAGTLHMEFAYLTEVTGNQEYLQKVVKIRDVLRKNEKVAGGLYSNYLSPHSGGWGQLHASIGALGDSFYEYLIKEYLRSGRQDRLAFEMFEPASDSIEHHMLKTTRSGFLYAAEWKPHGLEHKMDHLACFIAGTWGLAANETKNKTRSAHYLDLGAQITRTCHESYTQTKTKLGPEIMRFEGDREFESTRSSDHSYLLRPETIEAYFYMWRLTHDPKYREWAWEAAQAMESTCRAEAGYSGVRDVYQPGGGSKDDVQQSFFLAETLKYLYLIFAEDHLLPLSDWVFNTEAHPLPVRGRPAYRSPL